MKATLLFGPGGHSQSVTGANKNVAPVVFDVSESVASE